MTGKEAQHLLDCAYITTNKNTIPGETRSPFQTSGLRLGTPAVTTRGMKEPEMERIAGWIDEILTNHDDIARIESIRNGVIALCEQFPLPYEDQNENH